MQGGGLYSQSRYNPWAIIPDATLVNEERLAGSGGIVLATDGRATGDRGPAQISYAGRARGRCLVAES